MTTLDDVRQLARQLTTREQAQLISDLAAQLADARALPQTANDSDDDAWDDLARYRDEAARLPPLAEDSAAVVSAMRR